MSTQSPPAAQPHPFVRYRWALWALLLLAGAGIVAALFVLRSTSPATNPLSSFVPGGPDVSWPAGAQRAPGFRLTDQAGAPVSLAALRGRPVIVTFIDPLCRNLCPLEAKVLNDVVRRNPNTAVVAVSVNVYGNTRANLLQDVRKWQLVPQWRWAVGGDARLARVWKDYQVQVLDQRKTIAGVTVHNIVHTEAAYLVDPSGYQRALYLYPFRAADVERTLRAIGLHARA